MMAEINPKALEGLRHRPVRLHGSEGPGLDAMLEEVRSVSYQARRGAPATEQVSLVFAVRDPEAGEGTYRVEGPELVLENLFLTAVGGVGSARRLEAIITRIV